MTPCLKCHRLGPEARLALRPAKSVPVMAALASIVETGRRLDINPRTYLGEGLPKLGQWPIHRVGELTPTAWKAARAKKT